MKEYIEREAAIHAVVKRFWSKLYVSDVELGDAIEELPAADVVERKRGEWVTVTYDVEGWGEMFDEKCSVCGFVEYYRHNFCPHCGADMREVDHEAD